VVSFGLLLCRESLYSNQWGREFAADGVAGLSKSALGPKAWDGSRHQVRYNPHTSECEGLPLPVEPGIFAQVARVAKDKPLGKSRAPRILKIQLGLSCNYACSYCNQAFQIADATVSKLTDVEHFLIELDRWITGAPETIELWGGEPFLYWAKIKRLVHALAERFPAARFSIVTTGSLLSRESWISSPNTTLKSRSHTTGPVSICAARIRSTILTKATGSKPCWPSAQKRPGSTRC
jgi:hypothetical protein